MKGGEHALAETVEHRKGKFAIILSIHIFILLVILEYTAGDGRPDVTLLTPRRVGFNGRRIVVFLRLIEEHTAVSRMGLKELYEGIGTIELTSLPSDSNPGGSCSSGNRGSRWIGGGSIGGWLLDGIGCYTLPSSSPCATIDTSSSSSPPTTAPTHWRGPLRSHL